MSSVTSKFNTCLMMDVFLIISNKVDIIVNMSPRAVDESHGSDVLLTISSWLLLCGIRLRFRVSVGLKVLLTRLTLGVLHAPDGYQ